MMPGRANRFAYHSANRDCAFKPYAALLSAFICWSQSETWFQPAMAIIATLLIGSLFAMALPARLIPATHER